MKVRMTSSIMALMDPGYRRATMVITKGGEGVNRSKSQKSYPSTNCSLQLESMKMESLVIVDHGAMVNMSTSLVHTARHAEGVGFASISRTSPGLRSAFGRCRGHGLWVGRNATERVGSMTAVKS